MAVFTYAVKYWVTGTCNSPLRTSNADGETENVLRTADGQAFIQAPSLAGAMKNWLQKQESCVCVDALFGGQEQAGHLVFSDALFDVNTEMQLRPRLRIDGKTGSAANGGKFDIAQIGKGAKFTFSITWMAQQENAQELAAVEKMLAALHHGQIRVGGQKTNGFGSVSLSVKKQSFDMKKEADREAWLADAEGGTELQLPTVAEANTVRFLVYGQADSILVKAGTMKTDGKNNWTVNIEENKESILPASSVKGAVRARAEMIAKHLEAEKVIGSVFGNAGDCHKDGLPGKVIFKDVILTGQKQKITRIRVDKFTGGVIRQGLFVEEPLCSPIQFEILMQEELGETMDAACALMLFALKDLGQGLYHLGSGWGIGRGEVKVDKIEMQTRDAKAVLKFEAGGNCTLQDESNLVQNWLKRLEEMRHEN